MSTCKNCKHREKWGSACPVLKETLWVDITISGDAYAYVNSIETPDDFFFAIGLKKRMARRSHEAKTMPILPKS